MSDQPAPSHDDEHDVEMKDGPGHRLSAARQARGLAIGDIAAELHLKPSIIAALEHERYEELHGAVYVTGYMRSYARLLSMDPEPLLDAVRSAGPLKEPRRPRVRRTSEPQVDSGHLVMRLVSIAIVLVVVGLAFVWWQNQRPSLGPESEPPELATEEAVDEPAAPEQPSASEPSAPASSVEPSQEEQAEEQASEPAVVLEPPPPTETPQEGAEVEAESATPPVGEKEDTPSSEQAAAPEEETEEEPAASEGLPASVEILLEFNGPSWVDIRDSEREYKLFGEMKKGDRHVLGGKPPYSVIIGNASAVQVQIEGAPFDLNAIAKGNVARFTLDPENLP